MPPIDWATPESSSPSGSVLGIEGLVAAAGRTYSNVPDWQSPAAPAIIFWVGAFDTVQRATNFAGPLTKELAESGYEMIEVPVAPGSIAYIFTFGVQMGATELVFALLVFLDGTYVHSWVASDPVASPGPLLEDIARRVLGREAPTLPASPAEGLFALLPGPEDVPPGFVLVAEGSEFLTESGTPIAAVGAGATPKP
jgi:hypothetical protein